MIMCGRFLRVASAAIAALSLAMISRPAFADGTAEVYQRSILPGANDAIKNAMQKPPPVQQKVAQAPPVSQQRVGPYIGLPLGFSGTADVTSAYPRSEEHTSEL